MPDISPTSWRHRATAPICMVPTSECLYAQSTHWRHLLFKVLYNFPQQALLLRTPTGVREEKYTVPPESCLFSLSQEVMVKCNLIGGLGKCLNCTEKNKIMSLT